jgi:hypothetical protein
MLLQKLAVGAALLSALVHSAYAQVPRGTAYQLAELSVDSMWDGVRPMMHGAMDNVVKSAEEKNGVNQELRTFVEEYKNAFNRENLILIVTSLYAQRMTEAELREALAFVQSPVGMKFNQLGRSLGDPQVLVKPILAEACSRARVRIKVTGEPSEEFNRVCQRQ